MKAKFHIRWLIRRDMPEVLEIGNQSFEFPWSEDDFTRCLRQRNCIGMVAEHEGETVGFMVYELYKSRIHVIGFAVDPYCRRCGVGKAMIAKLIDKLSPHRRSRILLEVRDSNLDAQLFFRNMGFRAIEVVRDFYGGTSDDAYRMRYEIKSAVMQTSK